MGIWDLINSGTETVKRNTPDLSTSVIKVCKASYHYSSAAIRKIDDVRVNGLQKLGQYIYKSDEEDRAKIVNFCTKFAKNASAVAVKEVATSFIPGGRAVSQIYSQTVREMEIESKLKNQNTSCDGEITGNSSKDTTTGTDSPRLFNNAETSKRIGNSSKDTTTGTDSPRLFNNAEISKRIGNSSKDANSSKDTTTGTDSLRLFNNAETSKRIGNSSKDTTTGTDSPRLFNNAEISKRIGNSSKDANSSKDTTTGTDSLRLFNNAETSKRIGNSSKDAATATGSPELFNGTGMPETVGNSSQDTTTTSSPKLLDGAEISGRRELRLGGAQLSLPLKAKL